ncbi:MAG: hypothetical protein QOK29_3353 [Rhodospirillaceae bacterium]|nr:hypothetical protein [Rhodospirillaceae bacterium]
MSSTVRSKPVATSTARTARCSGAGGQVGRWAGILPLVFLLGACAPQKQAKDLSLVCEVSKCDCAKTAGFSMDSKPVEWRSDGSAFCPAGYYLRSLEKTPSMRMTT